MIQTRNLTFGSVGKSLLLLASLTVTMGQCGPCDTVCAPPNGDGGGGGGIGPRVLVQSSFDAGNEDWTLDGRNPFWSPTGGANGGHIFVLNERGRVNFWSAPPRFHGDRSAAAGGTLDFNVSVDIAGSNIGTSVGTVLVRLIGNGKAIMMRNRATLSSRTWTPFSLRLDVAEGWALEGTGGAASNEDIRQVLASLTGLQINADWDSNGNVSNTRLDGVSIRTP